VADEDGVGGLDDHEVLHAAEGDHAPVADGDRVARADGHDGPRRRFPRRRPEVLGERGPRADVVPVEVRDDVATDEAFSRTA
jgi:hypothetical protein